MSRIDRGMITMKPRWYFVVGSLVMMMGVIGSAIMSAFLVSLVSFSLRTHGPMGEIRYQQLLSNFPWWAPIVALFGLGLGIWLLNKYDFSYKRNFVSIVIVFIAAIILSGWLLDYFKIDSLWAGQGPMKRLYQQYDGGWRGGSGNMMNRNNQMYRGGGRGNGRLNNPTQ